MLLHAVNCRYIIQQLSQIGRERVWHYCSKTGISCTCRLWEGAAVSGVLWFSAWLRRWRAQGLQSLGRACPRHIRSEPLVSPGEKKWRSTGSEVSHRLSLCSCLGILPCNRIWILAGVKCFNKARVLGRSTSVRFTWQCARHALPPKVFNNHI